MLRFLTYFLGIIVALFLLGAGLLYTKAGAYLLNGALNKYLASLGMRVDIEPISSLFPLDLKVRDFSFQQADNLVIKARHIHLSFDAGQALFHHKLKAKIKAQEVGVLSRSLEQKIKEKGEEKEFNGLLGYDVALELTVNTFSYKHVDSANDQLEIVTKNVGGSVGYQRATGVSQLNLKSEASKNQDNSIGISVQAKGKIEDFALSYQLLIPRLAYQSYGACDISVGGNLEHLPFKPKGYLSMQAKIDTWGPLDIKTKIAPDDTQFRLLLEHINFPFAHINGQVDFSPDFSKIKGTIGGTFNDNQIPLTQDVKGKGKIQVDFSRNGPSLSGTIKASLSKASYKDYSIASLSLEAKGDNLLGDNKSANLDMLAQKVQIPNLPLLEKIVVNSEMTNGIGAIIIQVRAKDIKGKLESRVKQKNDNVEINLDKFSAIYQKIPLELVAADPILISPHEISIPKIIFSLNKEQLTLAIMKKEKSLNGQLIGALNLAWLSDMFVPSPHYVAGKVTTDLRLGGTISSPEINGTLTLAQGEYENVEEGIYVDHIETRAQFNGHTLTIPKLQARSHRAGAIHAQGRIDFIEKYVEATLHSKGLPLLKTPSLNVSLAGLDLTIKGPLDKIICKGAIDIGESKVNLNAMRLQEVKTLNFVSSVPEEGKNAVEEPANSTGLRFFLDINLKAPPVLTINGRGLESTWKGDFYVKGHTTAPQVKGALKLTKGTMAIFGNTLDILRGSIVFSGDQKNIPFIDIGAHIFKNKYDLQVGVTGSLQNLRFSFTSAPALPKEEVLSQILFGKISKDLSPLEAIQLANSLHKMFGSGESMDIMGALATAVGVDEISISTNDKTAAPTLHVKKKLSDKVQVRFEQSADLEENKVAVETALTDNISAKVEHGFMRPNDTIALMYSKDY